MVWNKIVWNNKIRRAYLTEKDTERHKNDKEKETVALTFMREGGTGVEVRKNLQEGCWLSAKISWEKALS